MKLKVQNQSTGRRPISDDQAQPAIALLSRHLQRRLDGIDIHFAHFASTETEYLEDVRMATLKAGIHICYIGVSNNFGMTGDEQRAQIDNMKKWIDVADTMGIQMVRSFGGWVTEGETEDTVWPRIVSATKEVAEYGASKGVVVGLHNHNHGCAPATGEQVLKILEEVDNPYYSHILDTGQYRGSPGASLGERGVEDVEHNFYGSIEASAPKAVHVRAKIYRIASGAEAWLDYDRIMKIIKSVGFNGWMSVVFEGQDELDEPTAVPLAAEFLRRKLSEYGL